MVIKIMGLEGGDHTTLAAISPSNPFGSKTRSSNICNQKVLIDWEFPFWFSGLVSMKIWVQCLASFRGVEDPALP